MFKYLFKGKKINFFSPENLSYNNKNLSVDLEHTIKGIVDINLGICSDLEITTALDINLVQRKKIHNKKSL